ncbi:hypothetical protein AB0P07_34080 [Streptomyces sp. NPDC085944]
MPSSKVPVPQQQAPGPRGDFARKDARAAIGDAYCGATRTAMAHLLEGDS